MKNSNVRRGTHWMILSLLLAAAGCGDDGTGNGNDNDNGNGNDPPAPVVTTSVDVADFEFLPPNIQVTGGATVTWTWTGSVGHNETFANAAIDSKATQASGSHQAAMPTGAGTYTYQCTIHPSTMQGTVLVP